MKYLIALSIVQAFALLFFGTRVMEVEARSNEFIAIAETSLSRLDAIEGATDNNMPEDELYLSDQAPTLDEIRSVVRDELATIENARLKLRDNIAIARPPEEIAFLKDEVLREFSNHVAVGEIGSTEMIMLQRKIARLPPADREDMMKRITRAMNAGDLKGEL